jgi:hypothetical protein
MAKVQVGLFLAIFPSMFLGKGLHFALTAHFCGIIKDHGLPKFNREYWGRCIADDNLHSIFFCVLYLMFDNTAFWLIPEAINAALALSKLVQYYPSLPAILTTNLAKVREMEG